MPPRSASKRLLVPSSSSVLRSQPSALDSRVTLLSLENQKVPASTSSQAGDSTSRSPSKRTRSAINSGIPYQDAPSTSKRTRTSLKAFTTGNETSNGTPKPSQSQSASKEKSPRKAKVIKLALDSPHPPPPRWQETYALIKEQRASIVAPVDTMGCDKAGDEDHTRPDHKLPPRSDVDRRLSCLVSLMLSSQTKDEVTSQAVVNLRLNLTNGLTIQSLRDSSLEQIQGCINKVGFWRRKSEYIKEMAEMLYEKHQSDVPKTLDELVALKGVGPKMAFLALSSAWSINEGIGVDTHVHRITNRLGWHDPPTTDPEKTRLNLQSWLPKNLHQEINHMMVGFGQVICLPIGPRCDNCAVGAIDGLCPAKRSITFKQRSPKKKAKDEYDPVQSEAKVKIEVEQESVKVADEPILHDEKANDSVTVKQESLAQAW
ncbi:hypothetical protein CROQUDRAFT_650321 [Cronartium quercuum f. sp. fusiforme G11]|uniref:Endonuclease III homolog n=1 Tax=Cronartium quercuum f. sp. fusiforme G11 TaxID=708437 RepID=A0A9P6TGY0_9BASI|nr:hypothetical protein CROQUDRAFT_650321 [Cronartium quercuum f. sp. fusiforme G11]